MSNDKAYRMRVVWDKGRNMFASFFSDLTDIRHEVGDAGLNKWCIENLHLGISTIIKASDVLKEIDSKRIRMEFQLAKAGELEERRTKREEKLRMRLQKVKVNGYEKKNGKIINRVKSNTGLGINNPCPVAFCKARPGEKCISKNGTPKQSHADRYRNPNQAGDIDKAREFIKPLIESGQKINRNEIASKAGVEISTVHRAIIIEKAIYDHNHSQNPEAAAMDG